MSDAPKLARSAHHPATTIVSFGVLAAGCFFGCGGGGTSPDTGNLTSTGGAMASGGVQAQGGIAGPATTGGSPAAGGSSSQGGTVASGGVTATNSGGSNTGGRTGVGGDTGIGGSTSRGGSAGIGGSTGTGGSTGIGGSTSKGGSTGVGGNTGVGGSTNIGGSTSKGGSTGVGGNTGVGGSSSIGGSAGVGGNTGVGGGTSGCNATTTPVARHGQLRVQDGKLVNQCGKQVQLTGMSLYDWTQQGWQFYNATAVQHLAQDKKCASLRIPLGAANYPGQYSRVKTVMDACIANGIYCIPNWHVIGASNVANAKAFYVQLAKDYGNTPNIIYEPWNEPTTATWTEIKAYMEEIIAAVRPIDPDGIVLSGVRQWDQRPDEACANPLSDPNVGYVFHFYAASHTVASYQTNLSKCASAKKLIFATEYGGCEASGGGALNQAELTKWWQYMDTNLISSNAWAIETNPETSSVFVTTASATGPWPDAQITEWGKLVFAHVAAGYAVTMSQ